MLCISATTLIGLFGIINALKSALIDTLLVNGGTSQYFYSLWLALILNCIWISILLLFSHRKIFLTTTYMLQSVVSFCFILYQVNFHSLPHLVQLISLNNEAFTVLVGQRMVLPWQMILVFIDLPLVIMICSRITDFQVSNTKKVILLTFFTILCFITITWDYLNGKSTINPWKLISNKYVSESHLVGKYGLIGYLITDFGDLIFNKRTIVYSPVITVIKRVHNSHHSSFILIQIESMDSRVVNYQYNNKYVMPFLADLANKSLYFPFMLSYHNVGTTSDAEFAILNGFEPEISYPSMKLIKNNMPYTLSNQLRKAGYHTVAYHGNNGWFFNRNNAYPRLGFDQFNDRLILGLKEVAWGAPDASLFQSVLKRKILMSDHPVLMYLITMSSHTPFNLIETYYTNHDFDSITNQDVCNYLKSMAYVDECLAKYIPLLKAKYPDAYIIIYGDHTPGLSSVEYQSATLATNNQYLEFVPLLITPDPSILSINTDLVVSQTDLARTILDLSGVNYQICSTGQNILSREQCEELVFYRQKYNRYSLYQQINAKVPQITQKPCKN